MYNILSVIVRNKNGWGQLTDVDTLIVNELREKYLEVVVTITLLDQTESAGAIQTDLTCIPNSELITMTLVEYYASLTEKPIEVFHIKRLGTSKQCIYSDIYSVYLDMTASNYVRLNNDESVQDNKPDIKLFSTHSSNPSMFSLEGTYLFFINGFLQKPEYTENGEAFLVNGIELLNESKQRHVSVADMSELGGVNIDLITADNVTLVSTKKNIARVVIDLGENFVNNTNSYSSVIGGKVNWEVNLDCIDDRYLYMDINIRDVVRSLGSRTGESLSWIESNVSGVGYKLDTFDAKDYLVSMCTGIIYYKYDDICFKSEHLGRTDLDGHYTLNRNPLGVVVLNDGLLGDYYVTDITDTDVCIACTMPRQLPNMVGDTLPLGKENVVVNGGGGLTGQSPSALLIDIYRL